MPLLKTTARGILSCCDRQGTNNPSRSGRDSATAAPPKHTFNRLNSLSWPTSHKPQWLLWDRKTIVPPRPPPTEHREEVTKYITKKIFTYDIVVFSAEPEKVVYRRLLLDFQLKDTVDAISDEIPQRLNLPITPYKGAEVKLPNGHCVMPIGTLEAKWQRYEGEKLYTTKLYVIEKSYFDMLLGRSSIWEYQLWDEDRDIQRRLQYNC
ncbi:hypothetical protein BDW59DRAFT_154095 [Aspergillus cavernicola]|uniref:Uncharacterized protein n=1 Tax=Aspergillus cavernicola TaxID=176166 RepID=A0ABR4HJI6_9EURO